ncbi:MAG: ABC transporter ATP-binding protein, partial [Bacteroidetes bacterium]
TNDLDLPTLRVLEEALIAFKGCVIAMSHDRYFLNRVCNGILAFEGDGYVHFSEGDYDYYLEKRNIRIAEKLASAQSLKKQTEPVLTRKTKPASKLKWKEKKELETIEQDIMNAESEVKRFEAMFSLPDFYEKHGTQINQLTKELSDAKQNVERLYARWHELEEMSKEAGG